MRHAVFSGNSAVYMDMEAAAKALVANSSVDRVHFLIDDGEFPVELPDIVEVRNVHNQRYFPHDGPNFRSRYSHMALMRAALCWEFPDLDEVLSLDCDAFCVDDIDSVWDLPLGCEYYLAASHENHRTHNGLMYCNTGVALYNLEMLRETGKASEVVDVLNRRAYTWLEQDVFSYLCQGRIYDMPSEFNSNPWTDPCDHPRIVHFAGESANSYRKHEIYMLYAEMPWEDAIARKI